MRAPAYHGVVVPVSRPRVTLRFNERDLPPYYTQEKPHRGVDLSPFPGATGDPVRSPVNGTVVLVGFHLAAGNELVIRSSLPYPYTATALDGVVYEVAAHQPFWLRLAHNHEVYPKAGEQVAAGEVVARIGATGRNVTGPHLHFELRINQYENGLVLDPLDFLSACVVGFKQTVVYTGDSRV
jgi:murein DD-endopeptidase MepM/ murein hydrolase activator NlpD